MLRAGQAEDAEAVDVSRLSIRERAFQRGSPKFGKVDILGQQRRHHGPIKPAWEYPLEDWDRVIADQT